MSQEAKVQLSVLGAIFLLGTIAGLVMWNPLGTPDAGATITTTAPVVIATNVTIDAPISGSSVKVMTTNACFESGTVDADTKVWVTNVTTGVSTTMQSHHMGKTVTHTVIGSFGDLIRVEAENNGNLSVATDVGYVPVPSDAAPPDVTEGSLTTTYATGPNEFQLWGPLGIIFDNSFPVTVTVTNENGQTDSASIAGNGTASTVAIPTLSVPADNGERVRVTFEDDVGNVSVLVFDDNGSYTAGTLDFHTASPNQVDSEVAGTAGMISVGDGQSAVTAYGRDFIHTIPLCNLKAPVVSLPVVLTYRSGIAQDTSIADDYDGPVGLGFDWNLDARIEYDSGSYYWYPGDGRRIGPFDYSHSDGSLRVYDSPAGVFTEFAVVNGTPNEMYMTAANGSRWVFSGGDGYLIRIEDYFSYNGSPSDPVLNRVTLTRNDDDRVVRAELGNGQIVTFGWHKHGRLASIEHHDRVVDLYYETTGALSAVVLASGAQYDLTYDTTVDGLLEQVEEYDATTPVTIVDNTYEIVSNLNRLKTHRNRHNPSPSTAMVLGEASSKTTMTDTTGVDTIYEYSSTTPHELLSIEFESDPADRGSTSAFPGPNEDPGFWRIEYTINADNYLRASQKLVTEAPGTDPTTDWHEWGYQEADADDPKLRARVRYHALIDPSTTSHEFQETWTYGTSDDDFWPSKHSDFDQVETNFTYNSAGQVLTTTSETVKLASLPGGTGYTIESSWSYDLNGRLTGEMSPNRSDSASSYDSMIYDYAESGNSYGYLETAQEQGGSGTLGPWTSYLYDEFGNAIEVHRPNRESGSDQVTTNTFDAVDRVTQMTGPDVDLTDPAASSQTVYAQTKYTYQANQFRLATMEQKHWTEVGGAGAGGTTSGWIVTSYSYDSSGRTETVEADVDKDGTVIRSKSVTEYTDRGQVSKEKTLLEDDPSDVFAVTEHTYDARGMLLMTSRDPDASGSGADPIETWFRYDGMGRTLERFEEETESDFFETNYDDYGRVTSTVTPLVYLSGADFDGGSPSLGLFRTVTNYNDGSSDTYRATGTTKEFQASGQSAEEISETLWEWDEAGRRIVTKTWFDNDTGGRVYSVQAVDLFPGGGTMKSYVPEAGSSSFTDYTETILESKFHRPETVQTVSGSTTLQKTVTTYDETDQTGWVIRSAETGWDEAASTPGWGSTYTTDYVHDEIGRVVEMEEYGTSSTSGSPERVHFTHYDGMGRQYQTYVENAAGTETGIITKTFYDLGGRRIEERRGLAFGSTDLFETSQWTYDLAGRMITSSRVDDPDGTPVTESTAYTYDRLGRTLTVELPDASTTTYVYGYDSTNDNIPTVEVTDEEGVERTTTQNQIGNTLVEEVTSSGSLTLEGAAKVEYTYDSSTGCGCMASGSPHLIKTFESGGSELTAVTRKYSPRGEITLEEIVVTRTSATVTMETLFEYDAAGRKTQITYPVRPSGGAATVVNYDYRSDGRLAAMDLDEQSGSGSVEIGSYLYEGSRERLRTQNAYKSTTAHVADTETTYGVLGRPEKKDYDLATGMGFQSPFSTEITGRNISGQLTKMDQVPRSAGTTSPEITATYDGTGRLASEDYELGSAGSGALTLARTYTRDALGLTEVEEDWGNIYTNPSCAAAPDFVYTREYDDGVVSGLAPAGPGAFNGSNATSSYLERAWYYHAETRTDSGWLAATEDYYYNLEACDCTNSSLGGVRDRHYYRLDREYGRDAWGRMITHDYSRTLLTTNVAATGPGLGTLGITEDSEEWDCGTSTTDLTTSYTLTFDTEERVYDGYGRMVFSLSPMVQDDMEPFSSGAQSYGGFDLGLFHAYDGSQIIASMGAAPSGTRGEEEHDSHREDYRNSNTGQVDKLHFNRDPLWPGEDPANPWDRDGDGPNDPAPDFSGDGFATPLYDLQGRPALMNATPAGTGQDEAEYPDRATTYSMQGDSARPSYEFDECSVLACGFGGRGGKRRSYPDRRIREDAYVLGGEGTCTWDNTGGVDHKEVTASNDLGTRRTDDSKLSMVGSATAKSGFSSAKLAGTLFLDVRGPLNTTYEGTAAAEVKYECRQRESGECYVQQKPLEKAPDIEVNSPAGVKVEIVAVPEVSGAKYSTTFYFNVGSLASGSLAVNVTAGGDPGSVGTETTITVSGGSLVRTKRVGRECKHSYLIGEK